MNAEIKIRALRPFYLQGRPVAAGTVVSATPYDAWQIVGTRRGEFVNPDDSETARAAVQATDAKSSAHRGARGTGWIKGF